MTKTFRTFLVSVLATTVFISTPAQGITNQEVYALSEPKTASTLPAQCYFGTDGYISMSGTFRVTSASQAEPYTIRVRVNHVGYVRKIETTRIYARVPRGFVSRSVALNVTPVTIDVSPYFTTSPWTGTQYDQNRQYIKVTTSTGNSCGGWFGYTNKFVA